MADLSFCLWRLHIYIPRRWKHEALSVLALDKWTKKELLDFLKLKYNYGTLKILIFYGVLSISYVDVYVHLKRYRFPLLKIVDVSMFSCTGNSSITNCCVIVKLCILNRKFQAQLRIFIFWEIKLHVHAHVCSITFCYWRIWGCHELQFMERMCYPFFFFFFSFFNPLSPNIQIQILQTDLYTFP